MCRSRVGIRLFCFLLRLGCRGRLCLGLLLLDPRLRWGCSVRLLLFCLLLRSRRWMSSGWLAALGWLLQLLRLERL